MNPIVFAGEPPSPGIRPQRPVVLRLPIGAAERTQDELRSRSAGNREALVVWAGRPSGSGIVTVTHLLGLDCEATRCRLVVPLEERVAALDYLRGNQLLAFADLHTHPHDAFLSEADRTRPFSSRDGFYALVVPDFGRGPALEGWTMYESVALDWHEVELDARITR